MKGFERKILSAPRANLTVFPEGIGESDKNSNRDSEHINGPIRMGKHEKLREKILRGSSDANIRFPELCQLLVHLGFEERVRGDHHIFSRSGVNEIVNLQPRGNNAKPYQVRQVRDLILTYHLGELNVD